MTSWVYLFSKFTPEALLFEASFLFFICAFYFGYWILHKRKDGVAGKTLPAGMVKFYLNNMIKQAEYLRAQLFGLISGGEIPPEELEKMIAGMSMPTLPMMGMSGQGIPARSAGAGTIANASEGASDPALLQKLTALEAKMAEQSGAMDTMIAEKTQLEQELDAARAAAATAEMSGAESSGNSAAGSAEAGKLKEKVESLEARLAEYSVIEDDLANLKRLQQENAALKAALAQGGGVPVGVPVGTLKPAAVAAAPAPEPIAEPAPVEDTMAALEAATATSPESTMEPDAPASAPLDAPDASFESLVDDVEKSLDTAKSDELLNPTASAPTGASAVDTKAAAAPAAPSVTAAPPAPAGEADLVAEFEKMLNG